MTRVTWAPQAIQDVESIRAYVARDSSHVYRLGHDAVEIATVFHRARLLRLGREP